MLRLALRSVRAHRSSAVATGLIAMVGTALVVAMAALLATGAAASPASDFLTVFPLIVGGWVLAIVLFAMVSTVGVTLEGRAAEFTGIRLIGAEPRQIRRLVTVETALVSLAGAVPGLGLGYALGAGALAGIRSGGAVDAATAFAPGALLPLSGALVVVAVSVLAGWLGSRRPASGSVLGGEPPRRRTRSSRGRIVVAGAVVVAGLAMAATTFAAGPDELLGTAMTGPACVLLAAGAALFAPELIGLAWRALRRADSATAWLASRNLRAEPGRMRPLVTFLTLFVGVAAGTLGMQGIENASGRSIEDGELIAAINYLVVGLLATFMAVALVNNLIASVLRRRAEFETMRFIGAAPAQTRGMLLREVLIATAVSIVAGAVAALFATAPYAVVKTGSPGAAFAPVPYLLAAVVGIALVVASTTAAGRRAVPAGA